MIYDVNMADKEMIYDVNMADSIVWKIKEKQAKETERICSEVIRLINFNIIYLRIIACKPIQY